MKRRKKTALSCVNGMKGAISLFLAVLMTPFLTIAMLLVETGRYNSAVSVFDEALGVTSVSILANYDKYLKDRWGLFALDQGLDLQETYEQTLNVNSSIMGNTIKVNNTIVEGMYNLADPDILRAQVLEYCKLNAPTKLATEFVNISDLIGKLEKIGSIGNIFSLLSSGVDVLDSGITLLESHEKMKESAKKLEELIGKYESGYIDFENAVNTLIAKLNRIIELEALIPQLKNELTDWEAYLEELQAIEEKTDEDREEIKETKNIISDLKQSIRSYERELTNTKNSIPGLRTSAQTEQTDYAELLRTISKELENFKTQAEKCVSAAKSIQSDLLNGAATAAALEADLAGKKKTLEQAKKDLAAMEKEGFSQNDSSYSAGLDYKLALEEEVTELELQYGMYNAGKTGIGEMADSLKTTFDNYSEATLDEYVKAFDQLREKVLALNISSITASSTRVTRGVYKSTPIAGFIASDEIDKYLKEQEEELKSGSLSALVDGLVATYNQLMGLSVFFEDNLSSVIDTKYYDQNLGGLPGGTAADGGILAVIKNVASVFSTAISAFTDSDSALEILLGLKDAFVQGLDVIESIVQILLDFVQNVYSLLTGYDRLYYSTYMAYNLPCRTDFSDTSGDVSLRTMTGYSLGRESLPSDMNKPNIPGFNELVGLINTLTSYMGMTGKDYTFSGAELEYMLFGSSSEIANQLYVFVVLYLIRLASNIPSITSNVEVQALATTATIGYPVVIALYIFLEPLVQTVLLVNGVDQHLVPNKVYLSPSGLPSLVGALYSYCKLSEAQAEELGNCMVEAFSTSQDDYDYTKLKMEYQTDGSSSGKALFELSYREYCFILLLLTVSEKNQLARLSNLVQMETLYYYKQQKAAFTFDLKKSYSFLSVEADISVNQMLPSLLNASRFDITREHYRGY